MPSGLHVTLIEQFVEPQPDGSLWARFRFVAPELSPSLGFDRVEQDFPYLCSAFALPRLAASGNTVQQVVISISQAALDFGATDPDVTQYFEAFRVENDLCIWEGF